jgi:transposase
VTEVARRHDITRGLIHNWRREEAASLLGATVRFAPVTMTQSTPNALEATEEAETSGRFAAQMPGRIEIELPGGVRVRVEGVVDEEGLKRVLRALRR